MRIFGVSVAAGPLGVSVACGSVAAGPLGVSVACGSVFQSVGEERKYPCEATGSSGVSVAALPLGVSVNQ
jgi:hypothetical protein